MRAAWRGKCIGSLFKPVGEIPSKRKLQSVHSNVCGPMPTESIGRKNILLPSSMIIYSRCCSAYLIQNKPEVLDKFKEFEAAITTLSGQ